LQLVNSKGNLITGLWRKRDNKFEVSYMLIDHQHITHTRPSYKKKGFIIKKIRDRIRGENYDIRDDIR